MFASSALIWNRPCEVAEKTSPLRSSTIVEYCPDAATIIHAVQAREETMPTYLGFFWIFRGILSRAEIEFAKEEEDPDSEVVEGTETACVGLYRLDA